MGPHRALTAARIRLPLVIFLFMGFLFMDVSALAEDPASVDHFEARIRPLLIEKCTGCHDGGEEAESELAITSRQSLIVGGEYGQALVPGSAEASLLIDAVRWTHKELKMPPASDERLSAREIADLERWIDDGAVWPGAVLPGARVLNGNNRHVAGANSVETDHWAFQARSKPTPPEVEAADWRDSPIDRFIYAKLRERGLSPSPLADRRTLIRRASFDLTGLPPTAAEVDAFLADSSDQAYERLVDRLLESPHYGERWGRHWLDVARYADTQGDTGDFPIPAAYLYRNWVIDALNDDMPYDRFVQAQIAGDLLTAEGSTAQPAQDLMVATGFVALSRRFGNTKFDDHHLTIEDTIDTVGRGILGLTLRCARCHDHKFDPLLQTDYYALYGMFQSTRYPTMGASDAKSPSELAPITTDADARRRADEYFALLARYADQIRNHHRPWLRSTLDHYRDVMDQLNSPVHAPSGDEQVRLVARREQLLGAFDGRFRELMMHGLDWLKRERDQLADNPPFAMVFAVGDAQPADARMHLRGDPKNLGQPVPRGFPRALAGPISPKMEGSGRLELARWLTSPENPLTARVIVNRLWQQHFGSGIVATPSNFGVQGDAPSHPELLDYLANVLVDEVDWSLKKIHRRMMLTRTYRASSADIPQSANADPQNVYLWKYSRRRLDAEAIRDAILAASGRLDLSQGGEFPFPHWKHGMFNLNSPFKANYPSDRRSVYLMTQRLFRNPFFALFDGPDRSQSTATRNASTLPTQALYLMNSPFVQEQARAFADRVAAGAADRSAAIELAYRIAYGRSPAPDEAQAMELYLDRLEKQLIGLGASPAHEVRRRSWAAAAKALFVSNEFLFLD